MDAETARRTLGNMAAAFQRRSRTAQAYQAVYASPEGKTMVHDLLRKGGLLETATNPADSRFYEGRRSLALDVIVMLRWSEAEVLTLAEQSGREDLERLVE